MGVVQGEGSSAPHDGRDVAAGTVTEHGDAAEADQNHEGDHDCKV